jgi:hypothetical protein
VPPLRGETVLPAGSTLSKSAVVRRIPSLTPDRRRAARWSEGRRKSRGKRDRRFWMRMKDPAASSFR